MEPYQYWTIAGFICVFFELISLRTLPLVLAGSFFFAAVIAYKYPENYLAQTFVCLAFIPVLFMAVKPYIKKRDKNEHK